MARKKKAVKKRRHWTKDEKRNAAVDYSITGSYRQSERNTGIPADTIRTWANRDKDWDGWITTLNAEKEDEIRARYVQIIDKAQSVTYDKLDEATSAQANIISATSLDKVRVIDNKPIRITSSNTDADIRALTQTFADLADSYNARNINVIDEQSGEDDQD